MKYSKVWIVIFLIPFLACKSYHYSIYEKNSYQGESAKLYIEGSIFSGENKSDTILYYKFDLLTDSVIFKEHADLNIGIKYTCITHDSSYSIKLGFRAVPKKSKWETIKISNSGNIKNIINFNYQTNGSGMETSFGFSNDNYLTPVTSALLTDEEKMKDFLKLFEPEIVKAVNNTDTIIYSSACHLDGYFQHTSMKVALK